MQPISFGARLYNQVDLQHRSRWREDANKLQAQYHSREITLCGNPPTHWLLIGENRNDSAVIVSANGNKVVDDRVKDAIAASINNAKENAKLNEGYITVNLSAD